MHTNALYAKQTTQHGRGNAQSEESNIRKQSMLAPCAQHGFKSMEHTPSTSQSTSTSPMVQLTRPRPTQLNSTQETEVGRAIPATQEEIYTQKPQVPPAFTFTSTLSQRNSFKGLEGDATIRAIQEDYGRSQKRQRTRPFSNKAPMRSQDIRQTLQNMRPQCPST